MHPAILIIALVASLGLSIRPLGLHMARVFNGEPVRLERLLGGIERSLYRLCNINPRQEMTWRRYLASVLSLGVFSVLLLLAIFMGQGALPLNPQGFPGLSFDLAVNAAVSFTTNTNWQSYSGESTLSYFSQMFGITVQNFLSAATGMAVAAALFRGFARKQAHFIGNAYADIVRSTLYVLLPLSFVVALLLASQGVIQNMSAYVSFFPLDSAQEMKIPQGPVASMESIKVLGSNGGGFFNANSAHPYENPTPFSNLVQIYAMLVIAVSLTYTFGVMVGDRRQGWMLLAAMSVLFVPLAGLAVYNERHVHPSISRDAVEVAAGNMEGKELRFGVESSALFGVVSATTAAGAVNSMHDSHMPLSGLAYMLLMQLGEVVYGGTGSGMYGLLMFAVLSVFIGGLMVGRTPEFLCKKLNTFDVKMASLVMLVPTTLVLLGTAVGVSMEGGRAGVPHHGAHGFSQVLYAFSSATNNNGSAFAGLAANSPFYNYALAMVMLLGRYGVIAPVLAAAGALAAKNTVPLSAGTLPTHTPMFVGLLVGVIILIGALNYIPALALGSMMEHLEIMNGGAP